MSELAACPFCGGEPNVMLIEAHHEGQTRRIAIPLTDKWYEGVRCEHHTQWMTPEQWNRRANASETAASEWIAVTERLPDFDVPVLVTDGSHLSGGQRYFRIELDTRMRGYVDGKITDAFTEYVPNPDAGKRHEGWFKFGCSAFNEDTDTNDYDGAIWFEPTHWQPLPAPPAHIAERERGKE